MLGGMKGKLVFVCLLLLITACGSPAVESAAVSGALPALVSPDQLASRLPDSGLTIVDVRTTEELRQTGIIPGAVHIPLDQLSADPGLLADSDAPILIYCRSGNRSAQAQSILLGAGLSQVSDLAGGIRAWTGAGYELVPTNQFFGE